MKMKTEAEKNATNTDTEKLTFFPLYNLTIYKLFRISALSKC